MPKPKKDTESVFDVKKKKATYMLAQAKVREELYMLASEQREKDQFTWGELLTRCLSEYLVERGVITKERAREFVEGT